MANAELELARHEASHVVVGVTLGLHLRHATIKPHPKENALGFAWFKEAGHDVAHAIMYAAGCAYERSAGGLWRATFDEKCCREHMPGRGGFETAVRIATSMLRDLKAPHAIVTAALLARKHLGPRDIEALARGESLPSFD